MTDTARQLEPLPENVSSEFRSALALLSQLMSEPTVASALGVGDFGELVPTGGGDTIVLKKDKLVIGRREGCDIVLRFPNVSSQHARMTLENGYWFVKDLASRNGTKVNGFRVDRKRLDPDSTISFAKHAYTIHYEPEALGAFGPPPPDDDHIEEVLRRSLMDRAGLHRRSDQAPHTNRDILSEEENDS